MYSALTTFMLTFAILSTYQLIDGSARNKYQKELVENQKTLEQKIYWALQSVSAINAPAAGATSTTLSIDKIGFAQNPVVIDLNSGVVRLKRGSGAAQPITNEFSEIQDLSFHQHVFDGRPAIQVRATVYNYYASTSVEIDTTILTR